eukprot:m.27339 g.27339  ORF g.27339 m.27339 type:complete len:253 (-) comp7886_c0_seq2:259-1017(-)
MPKRASGKNTVPSILSFDVTYIGCLNLPSGYAAGLEATQYALAIIKKECKDVVAKVSLTVSIYGLKAMRTAFGGMKQDDLQDTMSGCVPFEFICDESIYRVAFGADVGKDYCFISQEKDSQVLRCYAFSCKSKKMAAQIADATAVACQRVFTTLALLKARVQTLEEANSEMEKARRESFARSAAKENTLVALIHHEGYTNADEKFQTEMMQIAGVPVQKIPYMEPELGGPAPPSKRTLIRQADPNEYERTRF